MMKLKDVNPEDLYTTTEVSELLHICVDTVRRKVKDNSISSIRIGRDFKFEGKDILEFVEKCKVGVSE